MNRISAYIIAYNEADKIAAAVNSVAWADEVIVADSGSTDGMVEIAEALGARVVQIPFEGFGRLRNEALRHCNGDWIFSLDADERCTPGLRDEILATIEDPGALDIYRVPRRNWFMGRWIEHSGWYPNYRQPQLFRKGAMAYTLEPVHEGYRALSERPIGALAHPVWQVPYRDLEELIHKSNRYSSLGVEKLRARGVTPGMWKALGHAGWAFAKHLIVKRGILDGWAGFLIAFGNFEGTFYRYAKLYAATLPPTPPEEQALARAPLRRTRGEQ